MDIGHDMCTWDVLLSPWNSALTSLIITFTGKLVSPCSAQQLGAVAPYSHARDHGGIQACRPLLLLLYIPYIKN